MILDNIPCLKILLFIQRRKKDYLPFNFRRLYCLLTISFSIFSRIKRTQVNYPFATDVEIYDFFTNFPIFVYLRCMLSTNNFDIILPGNIFEVVWGSLDSSSSDMSIDSASVGRTSSVMVIGSASVGVTNFVMVIGSVSVSNTSSVMVIGSARIGDTSTFMMIGSGSVAYSVTGAGGSGRVCLVVLPSLQATIFVYQRL